MNVINVTRSTSVYRSQARETYWLLCQNVITIPMRVSKRKYIQHIRKHIFSNDLSSFLYEFRLCPYMSTCIYYTEICLKSNTSSELYGCCFCYTLTKFVYIFLIIQYLLLYSLVKNPQQMLMFIVSLSRC